MMLIATEDLYCRSENDDCTYCTHVEYYSVGQTHMVKYYVQLIQTLSSLRISVPRAAYILPEICVKSC